MMNPEPPAELNPYAAPASTIPPDDLRPAHQFTGSSGFWRRVAAYIIDALLTYAFAFVGAVVFGVILGIVAVATDNQGAIQEYSGLAGMLAYFLVAFLYFPVME